MPRASVRSTGPKVLKRLGNGNLVVTLRKGPDGYGLKFGGKHSKVMFTLCCGAALSDVLCSWTVSFSISSFGPYTALGKARDTPAPYAITASDVLELRC